MSQPARRLAVRGEVERRHEGELLLHAPGDAVIVRRDELRSVMMACPDGCGETLTVNLDPRAGKAWRFYTSPQGVSLFPSVWLEGGCKSHFIIWRGHIIWCDRFEEGNVELSYMADLETRLLAVLDPEVFEPYDRLAAKLGEIPWEASRAARQLVRRGLAEPGPGVARDSFRRAAALPSAKPATGGASPVQADEGPLSRLWNWIRRARL